MMKDDQAPDGDQVGIGAAVSIRDLTKNEPLWENGVRTMKGDRTWTGDLETRQTNRQKLVAAEVSIKVLPK